MNEVKFGTLVQGPFQRDAVHVACIPLQASTTLSPGGRVDLTPDGQAEPASDGIGIVDPWLVRPVRTEEWFWCLLHPNTVTGMRHHWSHPSFVEGDPNEDRKIVEMTANTCGITYDALMEAAASYVATGWHVLANGEKYKDVTIPDWIKFWQAYSRLTGVAVEEDWAPFTCSC